MESTPSEPKGVTSLTAEERERIAPYVTDLESPVFCLQGLPEEVVAVLFAYYSRSRDDLRTNLARLLADQELGVTGRGPSPKLEFAEAKAKAFHEKWVVGYGHASVAEHAVVHLALERVSIVASKVIEDARLAAYTEKSTRYVRFDQDSFFPLDDALPDELAKTYREGATELFETYRRLIEPAIVELSRRIPLKEGQSSRAYDAAIRAQAFDVLRYLLPAGTRTNVGMTINGRSLEHLLRKMKASPLLEIQQLAESMHREGSKMLPALLKYTEPSDHFRKVAERVTPALSSTPLRLSPTEASGRQDDLVVTLSRYDADALQRVATAIAYEQRSSSYADVAEAIRRLGAESTEGLFDAYVADRGRFDSPLRALEHASYTFDVLLDHGAYRDLQRHRMQSQTAQRLGMEHGFALPKLADDLGLAGEMEKALTAAAQRWKEIAQHHPEEAQYIVPLAARRRYALTCNLREAFHLIELRSARQGHTSYRQVAQAMWREIEKVHPWAARAIRVDLADYALARS